MLKCTLHDVICKPEKIPDKPGDAMVGDGNAIPEELGLWYSPGVGASPHQCACLSTSPRRAGRGSPLIIHAATFCIKKKAHCLGYASASNGSHTFPQVDFL